MRSLRNRLHHTRIEWVMRRWFDRYPTDKPLIYLCKDNGVTGIARAEDFDQEIMVERSICNGADKLDGRTRETVYRPLVTPIFLFSDTTSSKKLGIIGGSAELHILLHGCLVEERSFELKIRTTNPSLQSLEAATKYLHRV